MGAGKETIGHPLKAIRSARVGLYKVAVVSVFHLHNHSTNAPRAVICLSLNLY